MRNFTSIEQLRTAAWEDVEKEVVAKLRALHALVDKMEPGPETEQVVEDAIVPLMKLIASFCTNIKLDDETIELLFRKEHRPDRN